MRLLFAGLCVLLVTSVRAASGIWSVQGFEVDGVEICVALPAGYERRSDDHPVMQATRRIVPPSLRVLAGFYSPEKWRYCLVQQLNSLKDWRFNQGDWDQIASGADQSLKGFDASSVAKVVNEQTQKALGENAGDVSLRLEKPVILPVIDSSDRHFTFPILLALNISESDRNSRQVVVAACMVMVLREQLFYVYLYEPFDGQKTYEIITERARESARRTLEANR